MSKDGSVEVLMLASGLEGSGPPPSHLTLSRVPCIGERLVVGKPDRGFIVTRVVHIPREREPRVDEVAELHAIEVAYPWQVGDDR